MAKSKKAKRPQRTEYCDYCDGCGWTEGGKGVIMTKCPKCSGKGIVPCKYD